MILLDLGLSFGSVRKLWVYGMERLGDVGWGG